MTTKYHHQLDWIPLQELLKPIATMKDVPESIRAVVTELLRGDYSEFSHRYHKHFLTRGEELKKLEGMFIDAVMQVKDFIVKNKCSFGEAVVFASSFGVLMDWEVENMPSKYCMQFIRESFEKQHRTTKIK